MRTVLLRPAFGSYHYFNYITASTAFWVQRALCIIGYLEQQLYPPVCLAYRANYISHLAVLRYNFNGEPSYLKGVVNTQDANVGKYPPLCRSKALSALPAVVPPCVFSIIVIPVRITGLVDFSYLCFIALVFTAICVARC